jgi:hypothetical protein
MTTNTRLSLYKLFNATTVWVEVSSNEYTRILNWLERHRSNTSRRNAVDNLLETFVWFPTFDGHHLFVPLGHLTRLLAQVDERIPVYASDNHPQVEFRESLQRHREQTNGQHIWAIRMAEAGG